MLLIGVYLSSIYYRFEILNTTTFYLRPYRQNKGAYKNRAGEAAFFPLRRLAKPALFMLLLHQYLQHDPTAFCVTKRSCFFGTLWIAPPCRT